MPHSLPRHDMRLVLIALLLLCLLPAAASAQSLAIGMGLGLPLMDYITDEVGRDYRVTPEPGYYPTLKTLENAYGSFHFNASLILNFELPVDIEARFDAARMGWQKSRVTHVSCTPVEVINGRFTDTNAVYVPLDKVDPSCMNRKNYNDTTDISSDERASLWFFHISGGARYNFLKRETWALFGGGHAGLTISYIADNDSWLGGNADIVAGAMVRLAELIWIEFTVKLLFTLTQAPDDTQTRINHETQTGGNIFTSLVQPDAYIDFQISIRFDFSEL